LLLPNAQVAQVRSLAADLGITCITALKLDATRCLVSQQQEEAAHQPQASGSASSSAASSSGFEDEDEEAAGGPWPEQQ
jgi:hypothetical protein